MLKLKSAIGISIIFVFVAVGFLSLLFKGNNRTSNTLLTEQDLAQNSVQGAVGLSNKERSELIKVRDSLSRLLNQKQHELAKLQCEVSVFPCLGYIESILYVLVNIFSVMSRSVYKVIIRLVIRRKQWRRCPGIESQMEPF